MEIGTSTQTGMENKNPQNFKIKMVIERSSSIQMGTSLGRGNDNYWKFVCIIAYCLGAGWLWWPGWTKPYFVKYLARAQRNVGNVSLYLLYCVSVLDHLSRD